MAESNPHHHYASPPPLPPPLPPPYASDAASKPAAGGEHVELNELEAAPQFWKGKKRLSKQLSMCERPRDIVWERRRRQILRQERKKQGLNDSDDLTDEDLNELKGCIELGFGFNEEDGQKLCNTLPALDLYFAVNRQYLTSPVSSPSSTRSSSASASVSIHASSSSPTLTLGHRSSSFEGSPTTTMDSDSWKICNPGDDPEQVKTKLRHWAQAVACSVMQSH